MNIYWYPIKRSILPRVKEKAEEWPERTFLILEKEPPEIGDKALNVLLKWNRTKIVRLEKIPKKYKLKLPEDFLYRVIKATFLKEVGT